MVEKLRAGNEASKIPWIRDSWTGICPRGRRIGQETRQRQNYQAHPKPVAEGKKERKVGQTET